MKTKLRAAIHQPNYLPWLGYFEKMRKSDVFVIFDDVQLPLGGHAYETRTTIQTQQGSLELSVPVLNRGAGSLIKDVRLGPGPWKRKHLRSIYQAYGDSACYRVLERALSRDWNFLCDLNVELIQSLARLLGIEARIILSSNLGVPERGAEKILGILKAVGVGSYISGTGAGSRRYVDEVEFARQGVVVEWFTYQGSNVSVIDGLCKEKHANRAALV